MYIILVWSLYGIGEHDSCPNVYEMISLSKIVGVNTPLKSVKLNPLSSTTFPVIVTVSKAFIVSDIDVVETLYFGYANEITDPYPVINAKTQVSLKYLVDESGKVSQPNLSDWATFDVEGTWDEEGLATLSINPTGIVDLTTMQAFGSTSVTLRMIFSTEDVSKKFV